MNERIKDLFEQACFETEYDDSQNLHEMAERFAELIVQECASVGYDASYYECALNVSDNILKHFGVE